MNNPTPHINDMVGYTIFVRARIVYVGSYNSGSLNVRTVTSINYNENKVAVPDEKYPINADEVTTYD